MNHFSTNPFVTVEQVTFRSRVVDSVETPGELKEGTATDWLDKATDELIRYFISWLEGCEYEANTRLDYEEALHFATVRERVEAELAEE